jgi:beta-glucanase (GH16 family)
MSTYHITFRDWVTRTKLDIQNAFRYIFNVTIEGTFLIPSSYKLKFSDYFISADNWDSASTWWGQPYHPTFPTQWYDDDQIKVTSSGVQFSAINKPKTFGDITIPVAIGLMRSKQAFKYGIFSFSAKLPLGTFLWPALWLTGAKSWPPEIDLLEAYSDDTPDYHKNKELQSNVHMSDGKGGEYPAGARTHRLPNKVGEQTVFYTIWWEADFIKLYYNGYLVREIRDKEVLDAMFEEQQIIIGTGTQSGFNTDNLQPMVVSHVAVYQA